MSGSVFARYFVRLVLCLLSLLSYEAMADNDLPEFVFKDITISDESDDKVHGLIEDAAKSYHLKPRESRKSIIKALSVVNDGQSIDEYDYLWSQYGLLKSSFETNSSDFGPGSKKDYLRVAEHVLEFLDRSTSTGIWQYTDLGEFQMEVYREAGNGMAWFLASDNDDPDSLAKALSIVEKAEANIRDYQDYYIIDTKVRILLKMNQTSKAYQIVKSVLSEYPGFSDFNDIRKDDAYIAWCKKN